MPEVKKKENRVKPFAELDGLNATMHLFVDLYPAIVEALHDTAYGEESVPWNRETVNDANSLLAAIEEFSFVLALMVVLSYIRGVTVVLQQRYCSGN